MITCTRSGSATGALMAWATREDLLAGHHDPGKRVVHSHLWF
jgi:hypothetical protein